MQSHSHPINDETPFSTPLPSTSTDSVDMDPLIAQTAKGIADIVNNVKRELDRRNGIWATANGTLELSLKTDQSQTYELAVVHDGDGHEYAVTIRLRHKKGNDAANLHRPSTTPLIKAASASHPTRPDSDAELEKDVVPRKKRKLDDGVDTSSKWPRMDDVDDHIMPLITKDDLEELLFKIREDTHQDTSECIHHLQKLLRRFDEERHQKSKWDDKRASPRHTRGQFRQGSVSGATPSGTFPSPDVDRFDRDASLPDLVRKETKVLSSQIQWVEECRRVAAETHDKREENWRTSSAGSTTELDWIERIFRTVCSRIPIIKAEFCMIF